MRPLKNFRWRWDKEAGKYHYELFIGFEPEQNWQDADLYEIDTFQPLWLFGDAPSSPNYIHLAFYSSRNHEHGRYESELMGVLRACKAFIPARMSGDQNDIEETAKLFKPYAIEVLGMQLGA